MHFAYFLKSVSLVPIAHKLPQLRNPVRIEDTTFPPVKLLIAGGDYDC